MDYGKEFQKYATKHLGISSLRVDEYTKLVSQSSGIYGLTPNIIEERQMNASVIDIFSRLMMDRIIFLGTGIDDQIANIVQAQLLFLESADASKDIQIYLNSPGGSVYAGLGIYDTMQIIKWSIDASFAAHSDMKSHAAGGAMTLGKGVIYATSIHQKINKRSLTEGELVLSDSLNTLSVSPAGLWTINS